MNTEQTQIELTAAAQNAVNELTQEYKERLLLIAGDSAKARMSTPVQITLQDVDYAAQLQTMKLERLERSSTNLRTVFATILALLFIIVGLIVLVFASYRVITTPSDPASAPPLIVFNRPLNEVLTWAGFMLGVLAIVGILIALIWQATAKRITENVELEDRRLELLARWSDFERAARTYLAHQFGESESSISIRDVLHSDAFSEQEQNALAAALKIRNEIVHGIKTHSGAEYEKAITAIGNAAIRLVGLMDDEWIDNS